MTKPLLASSSENFSCASSRHDSIEDDESLSDDEIQATELRVIPRNVDSYTYNAYFVWSSRDTQPHCDYLMQALIFLCSYKHPLDAAGLREKLHALINNEGT